VLMMFAPLILKTGDHISEAQG